LPALASTQGQAARQQIQDGQAAGIVMWIAVSMNRAALAASKVTILALATLTIALSVPCVLAQQAPAPASKAIPPAEASPNDIDGATLFATVCGWCHENGGRTAGKGPKLAGTTRSDDFILNRIRNGKPGAMPAFGGSFSEGQIVAILAYIRTLEDSP
jgi:mono/diheme cytochrome c family protein